MNRFWKDFGLGLRTYRKSFGFIVKNRMMHFYLYPLLFIILFSVGAAFGINYLDNWLTPMINDLLGIEEIPGEGFWDKALAFIKEAGTYLVSFLVWIAMLFIYYKLNKYLVLIVMSPIMALIAEKTDEVVNDRTFPFSWSQLIKDVWRGILIAIRNLVLEIGITIGLLLVNGLISLVFPPLSIITTPITTVVIFLVGAYYYGFATMDYTNERYRLSVKESTQTIRKYKGLAVANGSIFSLWLIIPIIGTYIGTVFAPITCTVGATLALLEEREKGNVDSFEMVRIPVKPTSRS